MRTRKAEVMSSAVTRSPSVWESGLRIGPVTGQEVSRLLELTAGGTDVAASLLFKNTSLSSGHFKYAGDGYGAQFEHSCL